MAVFTFVPAKQAVFLSRVIGHHEYTTQPLSNIFLPDVPKLPQSIFRPKNYPDGFIAQLATRGAELIGIGVFSTICLVKRPNGLANNG